MYFRRWPRRFHHKGSVVSCFLSCGPLWRHRVTPWHHVCHDMSTCDAMAEREKLSRLNLDALTVPEALVNTIRILEKFSTHLHPELYSRPLPRIVFSFWAEFPRACIFVFCPGEMLSEPV